jgi:hypothetical protein
MKRISDGLFAVDATTLPGILAARDEDRPQAICAGWFDPARGLMSAGFLACTHQPTIGEAAAAWAGCLAACLAKIDELARSDPASQAAIVKLVQMTVGSMDVVASVINSLALQSKADAAQLVAKT